MINKNSKIFVLISILILVISQIACKIEKIEEEPISIVPTFTTIPTNIPPTKTITPTNVNIQKIGIVANCEFLNLRTEGNEKAPIIDSIPVGERIIVFGKSSNGWWYVNWNEVYGWVNSTYIELETGQ